MSKVKHRRGYVYSIQYHIVWCVKYRKQVLFGELEQTLKDSILKIAMDNRFEISEMETDKDHIHLLIDCLPQHSIPNIIKALKGVSARIVFQKHPELKNNFGETIYGTQAILLRLFQKIQRNKLDSTFEIKK